MPFEYVRPATLAEALEFLAEHGPESRLLAGGTDLILEMQAKKASPRFVVDIGRLSELRGVRHVQHGAQAFIEVGALTTVREVETSPLLAEEGRGLALAAASLASVQVRNRATLGGNICHAAPSADTAPALLVLDALAEIAGPGGTTLVPLDQFFLGPGRTLLGPCDILLGFRIPRPIARRGSTNLKHSPRRAMDCAVVGVGASISIVNGKTLDVRLALGAVAPTPMRALRAEMVLRQAGELSPGALAEAAHEAAGEAKPIDDIRASAWYRRRMVEVCARRALERAAMESAD